MANRNRYNIYKIRPKYPSNDVSYKIEGEFEYQPGLVAQFRIDPILTKKDAEKLAKFLNNHLIKSQEQFTK